MLVRNRFISLILYGKLKCTYYSLDSCTRVIVPHDLSGMEYCCITPVFIISSYTVKKIQFGLSLVCSLSIHIAHFHIPFLLRFIDSYKCTSISIYVYTKHYLCVFVCVNIYTNLHINRNIHIYANI